MQVSLFSVINKFTDRLMDTENSKVADKGQGSHLLELQAVKKRTRAQVLMVHDGTLQPLQAKPIHSKCRNQPYTQIHASQFHPMGGTSPCLKYRCMGTHWCWRGGCFGAQNHAR